MAQDSPPLPDPLPPDVPRLQELAEHYTRLAAHHPYDTVRVHAEIMLRYVRRRLGAAAPAEADERGPGFVLDRRRTAEGEPAQGTVHRQGCWVVSVGTFTSRRVDAAGAREALAARWWTACRVCAPEKALRP